MILGLPDREAEHTSIGTALSEEASISIWRPHGGG